MFTTATEMHYQLQLSKMSTLFIIINNKILLPLKGNEMKFNIVVGFININLVN
jgi:hypothetical protein